MFEGSRHGLRAFPLFREISGEAYVAPGLDFRQGRPQRLCHRIDAEGAEDEVARRVLDLGDVDHGLGRAHWVAGLVAAALVVAFRRAPAVSA